MFGNKSVFQRLADIESQVGTLMLMNTPEGRQHARREDEYLREQQKLTRDEIWEEYRKRLQAKGIR